MITLNTKEKINKSKIRVGRGIGSGKGKTSGRGVKDIVAKSMGTSNADNVIRATMKALLKQNSPKQISSIRNKKISEIVEKRG